jgi:hypothetical protein
LHLHVSDVPIYPRHICTQLNSQKAYWLAIVAEVT